MKNISYLLVALLSLSLTPAFAKEAKKVDESVIEYQKKAVKTTTVDKKSKAKKKTAEAAPSVTEDAPTVTSCQVQFDVFQDLRLNKDTVGTNFSRALTPSGLDTWLSDAEADLWRGKVKTNSGKTLVLKPKLERLYTYAESMNLHGVMSLSVDFVLDGKVLETRKYRGLGSTANAWNAEHEYYDALSYAAHEAMPKVLKDIPSVCAKTKS